MNRLAKVLGVLGGVAAVVWAIRDRFITVTPSREPETPTFRVVTPPTAPSSSRSEDLEEAADLTSIKGVGPITADKLRAAGIVSVVDFVAADPEALAGATGIAVERIRTWQQAASVPS